MLEKDITQIGKLYTEVILKINKLLTNLNFIIMLKITGILQNERNNPFNVKGSDFVKARYGYVKEENGVAIFDTIENGAIAGFGVVLLIYYDLKRTSLNEILELYSSKENTQYYIGFLTNRLIVTPTEKIQDVVSLAHYITVFEGQIKGGLPIHTLQMMYKDIYEGKDHNKGVPTLIDEYSNKFNKQL